MEKRYILFDLDGTLTDSYEGIINAFVYSLQKLGVEPIESRFNELIGPPLRHSYQGIYGMSQEESEQAIKFFREYYNERGLFENKLYEGIAEMLHTLYAHDKKLMIATAKYEAVAVRIADHFGLSPYLCFIAGTTSDFESEDGSASARTSKEDVIRYILSSNDIKDPEKAVMIGDRAYDISSAKKFGLQTVGVLYGFGTGEELLSAGPDYLAKDPRDVERYIIEG